jgi:hypothetical protein
MSDATIFVLALTGLIISGVMNLLYHEPPL